MSNNIEKPSAEAKALSLFLMAYKTINPIYKEKAKRINRQWDLVKTNQLSKSDYMEEVQVMLDSYGGYNEVISKTVKHYIDKTGALQYKGNDKYGKDAQKIADDLLSK